MAEKSPMEKKAGLFEESGLDAVFLRNFSETHDPAFYYFTGLKKNYFSNNFLILKKNKKPVILTSFLEYGVVKNKCRGFSIKKFTNDKNLISEIRHEFAGCRKIGLNLGIYPQKKFLILKKYFRKAKFRDVSDKLIELRAIKTPQEIRKIAEACKLSEKIIKKVPAIFRKGMKERELAFEIECLIKKSGSALAFPPIVASCRNSSIPHYLPADKKIGNGILLVDMGARYENYCSDITRMFFVGKAGRKEQEMYRAVYATKEKAESLMQDGEKPEKILLETEKFLKKLTGKKFAHNLGHGLGIEVHDSPSGFTKGAKWKLKENMVFAIEPAVYLKKYGIRIEDDVLVAKNGMKKLTNAPKELIEL